jgi:hypothetical protein
VDLAAGFFALAGVALGGVINEFRAWRDRRVRAEANLYDIRRELYAKALRQLEGVASQVAQWVTAADGADTRPFWNAMTAAYETLNEIRLVARDPGLGDQLHDVLHEYRVVVERNERVLPNPRDKRRAMVEAFRKDLGAGG